MTSPHFNTELPVEKLRSISAASTIIARVIERLTNPAEVLRHELLAELTKTAEHLASHMGALNEALTPDGVTCSDENDMICADISDMLMSVEAIAGDLYRMELQRELGYVFVVPVADVGGHEPVEFRGFETMAEAEAFQVAFAQHQEREGNT